MEMALRKVLLTLGMVVTVTTALPFRNAGNFTEYEKLVIEWNGVEIGYEEVYFNKEIGLIWFEGRDGSFTAQDLGKALRVTKFSGESNCFVSSIETSTEDAAMVESLIHSASQLSQGKTIQMIPDNTIYTIVTGPIQDTSFLPMEAVQRCAAGTYWRIPTGEKQAQDVGSRSKRACAYGCDLVYDSSCKCYEAKCSVKCDF